MMARAVLVLMLCVGLTLGGCTFPDGKEYVLLPAKEAAGLYRDGAYELCMKLVMGVLAEYGLRQYGPNLTDARAFCLDHADEIQQRRYYPDSVPRDMPRVTPNTDVTWL